MDGLTAEIKRVGIHPPTHSVPEPDLLFDVPFFGKISYHKKAEVVINQCDFFLNFGSIINVGVRQRA